MVIVYIALKTQQNIEIMSFFGDFYFKGVHQPFCHSFVRQKPLFVLCLSFVRPQSDPARSLIDFYLDKCERCPLFVMWLVACFVSIYVACSMFCMYFFVVVLLYLYLYA